MKTLIFKPEGHFLPIELVEKIVVNYASATGDLQKKTPGAPSVVSVQISLPRTALEGSPPPKSTLLKATV